MRSTERSHKQTDIDIKDYYALNVGAMWRGLRQESWAFWWVCIYFFFEYVRPQSIYKVIDILPYTQISLFFACIAALSDKNVKWVSNPGNTLFILFFIVVLVSGLFAFKPSTSWDKIDIIINWVIIYFLFVAVVNTEKRFIVFILLFLLVNFKMSQFGFRDFVSRGFGYAKWGTSGAPGWFKDAGDLGIEMAIFVPISVAFALSLKEYWGRYKKLFFYMVPITGIVTIIATSARGAQLGIAAAGIWVLLKARNFKAIVLILLLGGVVYTLLPEQMLEEFRVAGDDYTSRARIGLWKFGMEVIQEYPVLGVGYNNWLDYCWFMTHRGSGPEDTKGWCLVPHNSYITAGAETGYLGFALYVFLALFIFIVNSRTRTNVKKLGNKFFLYMAHALDAGLVAYLASSMFFSVTWYPFFWLQLTMTVALYEISKKHLSLIPDNQNHAAKSTGTQ